MQIAEKAFNSYIVGIPLLKRVVWVFEIFTKTRGSDFSRKKGGVGKIGGGGLF